MRRNTRLTRSIAAFGLAFCLTFGNLTAFSQGGAQGQEAPAKPPINKSDDSLLNKFVWRSIGPASMGGRIDDIEAVESNPFVIYLGMATGGVFKSVNNGTTWEQIFDTYTTASAGDIAICQSNPDIVWVGTGEPNNRQSSTFGDGIYKSTDGGKTFTNMGLKETQTIARVVIDPKDPNTVYVAALGHLFAPNKERGIYKTTDGGKTWNNVKFIDENTGFTDLAIDPADTKTLYAASYQRRRTPWGFNGGGPGCALWKTTDGGKTWIKLEGNGLPEGVLGRIGLDVARSNPNVLYAQIEVGAGAGAGGGEEQPGQGGGFGAGGGQGQQQANRPPDPKRNGIWRSDDKGKTWRVVSNNNNRPMYYSQIRVDPSNPETVYTGGLNFSKSTDGGKTFVNLSGVAHSDHHAIWINPKNGQHVMVGNDGGLDVSYDQGATFDFVNNFAAAQFYAVSADMRKPYYVCGGLQDNGSWCGPSATRTGGGGFGGGGGGGAGITNAEWFRVGGGDGFYTQNDPTDHNIIYAESQNGAVQRLDLRTGRSTSIRPRAAQRPRGPQGGGPMTARGPGREGGQTGGPAGQTAGQQNPQNPQNQGAQQEQAQQEQPTQMEQMMQMAQAMGFGNMAQSNIVPAPPAGEQYRFNWSTPVTLSPHNPRIVYVGANKFFKSLDRGDTWTASTDLTKQIDRTKLEIMGVAGNQPMVSKNDGVGNYSNITVIAESPVLPGVIWVGTDDGNVQLSKDGGASWTNVAGNVPVLASNNHQVSRVEPSHFDAGTCYLTVDGHRANDHKPYVYVTKDFGATWTSISNNLPTGNVNVIREDLKNKNLLFVGTEYGLFVSLNAGGEWKKFMTGLPTVRVDDLLIHSRDNDLIAGTHGRGIWICDDISALQQLNDKVLASNAHLFDIRPGVQWLNDVTLSRFSGGQKNFRGENPDQGTAISYYLNAAPSGDVKITISDINGKVVRNIDGTKEAGLNRVQWNLRGDPPPRPAGFRGGPGGGGRGRFNFGLPLDPGVYLVKLLVDGKEMVTKVTVEADTYKN
ncbi:MAG: hypothetical protein AB7P14_22600 [Blastocatellales bacterium]